MAYGLGTVVLEDDGEHVLSCCLILLGLRNLHLTRTSYGNCG
jgi:hypothetical protein